MYRLFNLYDKYYKHSYYYLYVMSLIHIILLIYTYLFQTEISAGTLIIFSINNNGIDLSNLLSFKTLFFIFIILLIDFSFLFILMKEFKELRLNYFKIFIIEIIILTISLSHPIFRNALFFLSLNTLQITIIYKIIKYIPLGKLLFLSVAYISLIKLLLYPLFEFIRLYFIFG